MTTNAPTSQELNMTHIEGNAATGALSLAGRRS